MKRNKRATIEDTKRSRSMAQLRKIKTCAKGVCLLVEGRGSRVTSRGSRVEGKWSRVEKFFTIIFERRQIKISYRPLFTRVSGARFIE